VVFKGYYGDAARTYAVGGVSPDAERLIAVTRRALEIAVDAVKPNRRVSDIGFAVQSYVESNGYSVVREFVGHGIGTSLHEDPQVPNFGQPGKGLKLRPGLVLAIEPMVNAGGPDVEVDADGWTARTRDGSLSAHFEFSVAVTETGARVLGI
jgi:methionyl aminopeptidase